MPRIRGQHGYLASLHVAEVNIPSFLLLNFEFMCNKSLEKLFRGIGELVTVNIYVLHSFTLITCQSTNIIHRVWGYLRETKGQGEDARIFQEVKILIL